MLTMTCPSCQESGKVPDTFIGQRIKCKKCGGSFLVTENGASAAVPARPGTVHKVAGGIEVDGLDPSAWSATETFPETKELPIADGHVVVPHTVAHSGPRPEGTKEYKLLTPRDKCFEGKFSLERLEEALNSFALQGWVVKSMVTPHVVGFSGTAKEELVVLLER